MPKKSPKKSMAVLERERIEELQLQQQTARKEKQTYPKNPKNPKIHKLFQLCQEEDYVIQYQLCHYCNKKINHNEFMNCELCNFNCFQARQEGIINLTLSDGELCWMNVIQNCYSPTKIQEKKELVYNKILIEKGIFIGMKDDEIPDGLFYKLKVCFFPTV